MTTGYELSVKYSLMPNLKLVLDDMSQCLPQHDVKTLNSCAHMDSVGIIIYYYFEYLIPKATMLHNASVKLFRLFKRCFQSLTGA